MTAAQLLSLLDKTLHQMRVIEVPDYDETNYVAICSCDFESKQMTTKKEADDMKVAGCPIEALERESRELRRKREAAA
jgi:hypothetical protein